ncbi:hypothetical protein PMAYCL1PPCAC_00723, partial [Pristionchus mayeri]
IFFTMEVVRSDRVTRQETAGQSPSPAVSGTTGTSSSSTSTTTLEKASTGDATFFLPSSGSTTQYSMDANSPNTVSTRSIDPAYASYGAAAPSLYAPTGNPYMTAFGGAPLYGGASATPFVMAAGPPPGMG